MFPRISENLLAFAIWRRVYHLVEYIFCGDLYFWGILVMYDVIARPVDIQRYVGLIRYHRSQCPGRQPRSVTHHQVKCVSCALSGLVSLPTLLLLLLLLPRCGWSTSVFTSATAHITRRTRANLYQSLCNLYKKENKNTDAHEKSVSSPIIREDTPEATNSQRRERFVQRCKIWAIGLHFKRGVKSNLHVYQQELSYRKQIARQLRTQYVEGIHRHKYYAVTMKSRLRYSRSLETEPLDRSYTT